MNHTDRRRLTVLLVLLAAGGAAAAVSLGEEPTAGPAPASPLIVGDAVDESRPATGRAAIRGANRTDVAPRTGPYHAAAGDVLELECAMRSSTSMRRDRTPAPQSLGLDVGGTLRLSVLDRRDGEIVVSVELIGARCSASTGGGVRRLAGVADALAAPALVRMADDGAIRGYRFAPRHGAQHRNLLRTLVSAMLFTLDADAPRWTRDEPDATGTARVDYRWDGPGTDGVRAVRKSKSRYAAERGHAPDVDGRGEASLDTRIGWLSRATYREELKLRVDEASVDVATDTSTTFRLTGHRRAAARPDSDPWAGPWASPCGAADHAASSAGAATGASASSHRADAARLTAEIARIASSPNGDGDGDEMELYRLREQLADLLQRDPAAVEAVRAALDGAIDESVKVLLVDVAGAAGTPAAQQLLQAVLAAPARSERLRVAAVRALVQVAAATPDTVRAVRAMVGDRSDQIAGTSMLALGAFVRRTPGGDALAHLTGLESAARARGLAGHWLEALGNTAHPDVASPALRYLRDEDPSLRLAAVNAMRHLRDGETGVALTGILANERVASVRAQAVYGLSLRDDDGARRSVERAARQDAAASVRRVAIEALGARVATDARARAVLAEIARSDREPALRDLASGFAAGR